MADNPNRLLIVDDEPGTVQLIERVARGLRFDVATAACGAELLDRVDAFAPTVVSLDLELAASDGVELLRLLAARGCKADVLLVSGVDRRVVAMTHDLGAGRGLAMKGMLGKPVSVDELRHRLAALLREDRRLGEADLREALRARRLVPYFQPKASRVEGGGWKIDGLEALVRWQHPALGLVMPDEFIPLAERSGLIAELTEQVIAATLRQLRAWSKMGLRLTCAVNLPPSLVTDLEFPDRLAALVAAHGLDGGQLAIEITETATMQDPVATMDILTRLRVKRIGLSLDDFGTGFSSLTRLYQMPFDEMKIDKSLVTNVPHSREANTMVGSLVELGHNLGLKICAEGVESRAALDLLEILGCDRCQGFFLSRAIPAEDIPGFIAHWNTSSPASAAVRVAGAVI